jgi:hypothetical protein
MLLSFPARRHVRRVACQRDAGRISTLIVASMATMLLTAICTALLLVVCSGPGLRTPGSPVVQEDAGSEIDSAEETAGGAPGDGGRRPGNPRAATCPADTGRQTT